LLGWLAEVSVLVGVFLWLEAYFVESNICIAARILGYCAVFLLATAWRGSVWIRNKE